MCCDQWPIVFPLRAVHMLLCLLTRLLLISSSYLSVGARRHRSIACTYQCCCFVLSSTCLQFLDSAYTRVGYTGYVALLLYCGVQRGQRSGQPPNFNPSGSWFIHLMQIGNNRQHAAQDSLSFETITIKSRFVHSVGTCIAPLQRDHPAAAAAAAPPVCC